MSNFPMKMYIQEIMEKFFLHIFIIVLTPVHAPSSPSSPLVHLLPPPSVPFVCLIDFLKRTTIKFTSPLKGLGQIKRSDEVSWLYRLKSG